MAILPEVRLNLWQVTDRQPAVLRFFVTWRFIWSRSFQPWPEDLPEFHGWLGANPDEPLDRGIARNLYGYLTHGHVEVTSLRHNFWRGGHGGNIIELGLDANTPGSERYPQSLLPSVEACFNPLGKPLVCVWLVQEPDGEPNWLKKLASEREFFSDYIRACPPEPRQRNANHNQQSQDWQALGPEPERIKDIASPASF